jgi:hypothetical protein
VESDRQVGDGGRPGGSLAGDRGATDGGGIRDRCPWTSWIKSSRRTTRPTGTTSRAIATMFEAVIETSIILLIVPNYDDRIFAALRRPG